MSESEPEKTWQRVAARTAEVSAALQAAGVSLDGTTSAALLTITVGTAQMSGMAFERFVGTALELWEFLGKSPPKPEAVKEEPT